MDIIAKIRKLEKRIQKLEKNYVPNQELKNLRNRLINKVKKGKFISYSIDEGCCGLNFSKIHEMLYQIKDKGNFYILLCGANCAHDVSHYAEDEKEVDNLLDYYYIKKIFDTRIDKDKVYLIALDNIKQKNIPDENIVMFTREYHEEKPSTSDLPEIEEIKPNPDIKAPKNEWIMEGVDLKYGHVIVIILLIVLACIVIFFPAY